MIAAAIVILVVLPDLSTTRPTPTRTSAAIPDWVFTAAVVDRDRSWPSSSPASSTCGATSPGLWVAIAGVVTGIVAAFVSAPISAIVFGGVTGSGTDLIVAALRQGGADVLPGLARPGPVQRPDRQADHELRRVHHPVQPVVALSRAVPAWRSARFDPSLRARVARWPAPRWSTRRIRGRRGGPVAPTRRRTVAAARPARLRSPSHSRARTAASTRRPSWSSRSPRALIAFGVRGWTAPIVDPAASRSR